MPSTYTVCIYFPVPLDPLFAQLYRSSARQYTQLAKNLFTFATNLLSLDVSLPPLPVYHSTLSLSIECAIWSDQRELKLINYAIETIVNTWCGFVFWINQQIIAIAKKELNDI